MTNYSARTKPGRAYRRDRLGRVSVAEVNRHMPFIQCAVCGQWVDASARHTLNDCKRRVKL